MEQNSCVCAEGYFNVTERTIAKQTEKIILQTGFMYTVNDIGKTVKTMKDHAHDCGYVHTKNRGKS